MGTRSLTKISDGKDVVACIYRQMDGYPSGHGAELAKILASGKMVNGISGIPSGFKTVFNGVGCLAAAIVANLKDGPGGIYLYPPKSKDCGEEYVYEIHGDMDRPLTVKCIGVYEKKVLYDGDVAGFVDFCGRES
jgi:hypothetical protein